MKKYLVIYRKNNKLYHAVVDKLTEKISVTNENFETVTLGYKNKWLSFSINDNESFFNAVKILFKRNLANIYIVKNSFSDCTQIKCTVFLLSNPFWDSVIVEKPEVNELVPEGEVDTKTIVIVDRSDWEYAEKEFDFKSDFVDNILN